MLLSVASGKNLPQPLAHRHNIATVRARLNEFILILESAVARPIVVASNDSLARSN